jgi:hypothetical protein
MLCQWCMVHGVFGRQPCRVTALSRPAQHARHPASFSAFSSCGRVDWTCSCLPLVVQSFSAGVGNWVADEVLYQSRVHPEQPANSIPADKVRPFFALSSCFLGRAW